MTLTLLSSSPVNEATSVSITVATSNLNAIAFSLQSDSAPINPVTLVVYVNGELIIAAGAPVASRFFSIISTTPTSVVVSLVFSNPIDSFASYETVSVSIAVSDGNSNYNNTLSFRIEDVIAPTISNFTPLPNSNQNIPSTPIFFKVLDQGSGGIISTLNLVIYENDISAANAIVLGNFQSGFSGSIVQNIGSIDVLVIKDAGYPSDAYISAAIQVQDENNSILALYKFQIIDVLPPQFSNLVPSANAVNISENSTVSFTILGEHVFGMEAYGSGIDQSSLNVFVNDSQAISNGSFVYPFLDVSSMFLPTYYPSSSIIKNLSVIMKATDPFSSALPVVVDLQGKDNRGNLAKKVYSFLVKDYSAPKILDTHPSSLNLDILPNTDIRFRIVEELDGYGVDFPSLDVQVDGYSVLNHTRYNLPVDGYIDGYLTRTFSNPIFDLDGYYETFIAEGYDGYSSYISHPGFHTTILRTHSNEYSFIINPIMSFAFNQLVNVNIELFDRGGNYQNTNYSFTTAPISQITTTAKPSTGTYKNYIDGYGKVEAYKFLTETGVTLESNLANTITLYTIDGSVPRINSNNQVVGTTQVYTQPILINKIGINSLKYFSVDQAGNKERVKQEIYLIDPLPPSLEVVLQARIVADIPFPTTIIPVEYVELFRQNQLVRILDDIRPPILTTILTINHTSNPPFIIVQDKVEKLKTSRNARVEITSQPIASSLAIEFDSAKAGEYLYIGSDGNGLNQADSLIEELRILNFASTDEEILADFTLLAKGTKFYNQTSPIVLSSEYSTLEKQRVNLPDQTLVLAEFDGSSTKLARQGVLTNQTTQIVDIISASNDIIFTIKIKKSEDVDRELLRSVLTNFAPADLNIIVNYEEIE